MSPVPSTNAAPEPQRPGLEAVPPRPKGNAWPVVLILILFAAGAAWQLQSRRQVKPPPAAAIRTVKAVRGNLQRTLRLSGSIAAGTFSNIFAPIVQAPDPAEAALRIIADMRQGAA